MDTRVTGAIDATTKAIPACGSETSSTLGSESPHEWLYGAACSLLGKDAGWQLAHITGYPESSCYAYVAHKPAQRRRQPDHFSRTLIHSKDGEQFFAAYMAGCTAPWWLEHQRAADIGRQVVAITK